MKLGGTHEGASVQLPDCFKASQKLRYISESIVQISLERACMGHHPPKKSVTMFDHPHGE